MHLSRLSATCYIEESLVSIRLVDFPVIELQCCCKGTLGPDLHIGDQQDLRRTCLQRDCTRGRSSTRGCIAAQVRTPSRASTCSTCPVSIPVVTSSRGADDRKATGQSQEQMGTDSAKADHLVSDAGGPKKEVDKKTAEKHNSQASGAKKESLLHRVKDYIKKDEQLEQEGDVYGGLM